jgi:hypothetical protein
MLDKSGGGHACGTETVLIARSRFSACCTDAHRSRTTSIVVMKRPSALGDSDQCGKAGCSASPSISNAGAAIARPAAIRCQLD